MEMQVSSAKRTITYEMTSEEAREIREWVKEARYSNGSQLPSVVRQFLAPLAAIAEKREYGGH